MRHVSSRTAVWQLCELLYMHLLLAYLPTADLRHFDPCIGRGAASGGNGATSGGLSAVDARAEDVVDADRASARRLRRQLRGRARLQSALHAPYVRLCYLNTTINLRPLNLHIMLCCHLCRVAGNTV